MRIYVNDDSDDGNGGDGDGSGDGNGKGDGNDAATAADAMMRMKTMVAIQGQQSDNVGWTTTMGQQQCDGNVQPATCRILACPSKATINYCGQFEEEETRERGDLGG